MKARTSRIPSKRVTLYQSLEVCARKNKIENQVKIMSVLGFLRSTAVFLWITIQHIVYWPEYVTWIFICRPILWLSPPLYWYLESYFYSTFITLFGLLSWYNGHKFVEYGPDITKYKDERCILMPNHQSLGDVPIMFALLQKYKIWRDFMWIMDKELKYTHFGFCAFHHGDCFIQQRSTKGRDKELEHLRQHVKDCYYPLQRKWVLIFPEGGLLYKRRARSQAYAKKNELPILEHVSLPRVGGVQVLFDSMSELKNGIGNGVKYVIDITIGHPKNETMSLQSFMIGTSGPKEVHAHYRIIPVSEIPADDNEKLTNWLYEVFVEKERLLAHFFEHGEFPLENGYVKRGPRTVTTPWFNFTLWTFCWMLGGYLFFNVYSKLWCCVKEWF